MLIDWFTVGAQFVNFLILVFLMKRLLYQPILKAIATREARIATALNEADEKKKNAAKELEILQQRQHELEEQKTALLKAAAQEAETTRKQLIAAACDEVSQIQARWREAMLREKDALQHQLIARLQAQVLTTAREVLSTLAGPEMERAITHQFIEQLRNLSTEEKRQITAFVKTSSQPMVIRSAFVIADHDHAAIENIIRQQFGATKEMRFETAPDLICGVELLAPGHKVSWNIEAHLAALNQSVDDLLQPTSKANEPKQQ